MVKIKVSQLVQDLVVMAQAMLAGITVILLMQNPQANAQCMSFGQTINVPPCQSYGCSCTSLSIAMSTSSVFQLCKPLVESSSQVHAFTGMIVVNQLAFLLAIIFRQGRWTYRQSLPAAIAICVLTWFAALGKALVVFDLMIAPVHFACESEGAMFVDNLCNNRFIPVNASQISSGLNCQCNCVSTMSCASQCSKKIQTEIFIMSVTFFLSALYISMMFVKYIRGVNMSKTASRVVELLCDLSAFVKLCLAGVSLLIVLINGTIKCQSSYQPGLPLTSTYIKDFCVPQIIGSSTLIFVCAVAMAILWAVFVLACVTVRFGALFRHRRFVFFGTSSLTIAAAGVLTFAVVRLVTAELGFSCIITEESNGEVSILPSNVANQLYSASSSSVTTILQPGVEIVRSVEGVCNDLAIYYHSSSGSNLYLDNSCDQMCESSVPQAFGTLVSVAALSILYSITLLFHYAHSKTAEFDMHGGDSNTDSNSATSLSLGDVGMKELKDGAATATATATAETATIETTGNRNSKGPTPRTHLLQASIGLSSAGAANLEASDYVNRRSLTSRARERRLSPIVLAPITTLQFFLILAICVLLLLLEFSSLFFPMF